MGAFKIQTDLDLSGFNLLNFCIQSYTDLENVPNLGLGRKLFFTGNSTDEKNLREVIWNGVEWKAAVYLDDIEALTNGEGSLGTRVKALEDMLKVDDANDVINTWAEIQAFLDQVQEGTDLMDLLNSKVDHVINMDSSAYKTLGYGRPDEGWQFYGPAISFGTKTYFAQIQVKHDGDQIVFRRHTNQGFTEWQTLIHTGNVGDYTAGSAKFLSDYYNTRNPSANVETFGDGGVRKFIASSMMVEGKPPHDGSILHFSWDSNLGFEHQLFISNAGNSSTNERMAWRAQTDGTWSDWKTIAFTDSDITGNAATATKLKDKVSLWGNEFDGTQSLSNSLILDNNKQLRIKDSAGVSCSVVGLGSDNNLLIGGDLTSGTRVYNMYLDGYNIYFRTGAKQTAMTITDEGNVLVGRQANNLDAIIETKGLVHIEGGSTKTALGSAPANGLTIGYDTIGGLAQWIHETNFSGNIQAMNLAGTATAYALNLNPLGGAVNVGGNLAPNANNSLSLGTSSYRWSDVYSVGGNFSGRVLIGGAADDGSGANLQVTGLAAFNGGALIPTGQTLTIGSVTFRETAAGEVEVDGNLHATGTLASGGKAAVGEGDNGGGGNANVYSDVLEGVITQEWEVGNPFQKEDVIVSLYMWNTDESRWEMVLADIGVTSENIWVTFGRPTSTTDKYMAVVMG